MNGYPVLLRPKGTSRIIEFGATGIICQDDRCQEEVIKTPLRHKVQGCSEDVVKTTQDEERFSDLCIEREKVIYQVLPKDPNILNCITITDLGLHFPYMRLGNLRQYLLSHNQQLDDEIREQWITMAASSIALIHRYDIIHADISTRNFLVADDLSIKLCDFAGSAIGNFGPLVEEEDRYRMPHSRRSTTTDIFALGCLIFEIMTGLRPFDEISDDHYEDIQSRYSIREFPCLDGLPYRKIIYKCWTCQYESVDRLLCELRVEPLSVGVDR